MSSASEDVTEARRWAGSTLDERAAERRRQLLDAGFHLLGTEGAGAVTVRAVTRDSGLSPRYFYEGFADREELLAAVFDDRFELIRGAVEAAMAAASADFEARGRASLDATARCLEEDPRLGRALLRETLADDTLRRHAEQRLPELVLGVALRSLADELGSDVDPTALQVAVLAVSGTAVALLLAWCEGQLDLAREELVDRLFGVISAITDTVRPGAS